jgi:dienelactone hydrolase
MQHGALSILALLLLLGCSKGLPAAEPPASNRADAAIEVPASSPAGFQFPYLLVPPLDAHRASPPFLLVETNNTGIVSDNFEVHRQAAHVIASVSSVGHYVAARLNVPFLVPIFPRPASLPLTYTHALDRDTLLISDGPLRRLDLQLIAMIDDARTRLAARGWVVGAQVLASGFSASGSFANRFALLHPDRVRGVACGGINGILTLPLSSSAGIDLPYPIGVGDLSKLVGATLSVETWRRVPQFVYMGADDDNDAVAFDDAYPPEQRRLVHQLLGARMQPDRWAAVQALYRASGANVRFRTYPGMGHGTNGAINEEVAQFFEAVLAASD